MGVTAHFAATHGFYKAGGTNSGIERSAKIMYTGALLFLVFASLFIVLAYTVLLCVLIWSSDRRGGRRKDTVASRQYEILRVTAILSLPTTYLASWVFWAGFVYLAGDL